REIEIAESGADTFWIHEGIEVLANVVVFVSAERLLPLASCIECEIGTGEKIILPRTLVCVRRNQGLSIEVVKRLDTTAFGRVPRSKTEHRSWRKSYADIRAL